MQLSSKNKKTSQEIDWTEAIYVRPPLKIALIKKEREMAYIGFAADNIPQQQATTMASTAILRINVPFSFLLLSNPRRNSQQKILLSLQNYCIPYVQVKQAFPMVSNNE